MRFNLLRISLGAWLDKKQEGPVLSEGKQALTLERCVLDLPDAMKHTRIDGVLNSECFLLVRTKPRQRSSSGIPQSGYSIFMNATVQEISLWQNKYRRDEKIILRCKSKSSFLFVHGVTNTKSKSFVNCALSGYVLTFSIYWDRKNDLLRASGIAPGPCCKDL